MNKSCCIHPDKKALSFCHNCNKYYCSDCLNEGGEFYYCNSEECLNVYKKDTISFNKEARKSNYADFDSRGFAFLIDWIVLFVFNTFLVIIFDIQGGKTIVDFGLFLLIKHPIAYITFLLYFTIFEATTPQATIGKMMQKIVVVDYNGERLSIINSFVRNISKFLSIFTLGFGFIMIIFTKKKQGLHDIIAKTIMLKQSTDLLPELVKCKECDFEVKLNYKERIEKEFNCPECNVLNDMIHYIKEDTEGAAKLPESIECPQCKEEVNLEETERNSKKFTCPWCNKFIDIT